MVERFSTPRLRIHPHDYSQRHSSRAEPSVRRQGWCDVSWILREEILQRHLSKFEIHTRNIDFSVARSSLAHFTLELSFQGGSVVDHIMYVRDKHGAGVFTCHAHSDPAQRKLLRRAQEEQQRRNWLFREATESQARQWDGDGPGSFFKHPDDHWRILAKCSAIKNYDVPRVRFVWYGWKVKRFLDEIPIVCWTYTCVLLNEKPIRAWTERRHFITCSWYFLTMLTANHDKRLFFAQLRTFYLHSHQCNVQKWICMRLRSKCGASLFDLRGIRVEQACSVARSLEWYHRNGSLQDKCQKHWIGTFVFCRSQIIFFEQRKCAIRVECFLWYLSVEVVWHAIGKSFVEEKCIDKTVAQQEQCECDGLGAAGRSVNRMWQWQSTDHSAVGRHKHSGTLQKCAGSLPQWRDECGLRRQHPCCRRWQQHRRPARLRVRWDCSRRQYGADEPSSRRTAGSGIRSRLRAPLQLQAVLNCPSESAPHKRHFQQTADVETPGCIDSLPAQCLTLFIRSLIVVIVVCFVLVLPPVQKLAEMREAQAERHRPHQPCQQGQALKHKVFAVHTFKCARTSTSNATVHEESFCSSSQKEGLPGTRVWANTMSSVSSPHSSRHQSIPPQPDIWQNGE